MLYVEELADAINRSRVQGWYPAGFQMVSKGVEGAMSFNSGMSQKGLSGRSWSRIKQSKEANDMPLKRDGGVEMGLASKQTDHAKALG